MIIDHSAETDREMVSLKITATQLLLFPRDEIAQKFLESSKNLGEIDLSRFIITKLSDSLLKNIAHESPTKLVRRESEMLTEVWDFSRRASELPSSYADRSKGCVGSMRFNVEVKMTISTGK